MPKDKHPAKHRGPLTGAEAIKHVREQAELAAGEYVALLKLSRNIRRRLVKWLANKDLSWLPTRDFMSTYGDLGGIVVRLLSEGRKLEKARSAVQLNDVEIREALRDVAIEHLITVNDEEFLSLLNEREQHNAATEH